MRPDALDTDDPLLVSRQGPDTDGSVVVSLGVTLAVVLGVLATTAPLAVTGALALLAAGYLLGGLRRLAADGRTRRRRRLCIPRTAVCLEV